MIDRLTLRAGLELANYLEGLELEQQASLL
jgi:hypothetical protein